VRRGAGDGEEDEEDRGESGERGEKKERKRTRSWNVEVRMSGRMIVRERVRREVGRAENAMCFECRKKLKK
jgi:hypothetical protein